MRLIWIASFWCLGLIQPNAIAHAQQSHWKTLTEFPNPVGVAGPFAGQSGSALLVAGGANFPTKKPWEGGTKVWHDQVYALDNPDGNWKQIGTLPKPLAYGISANWQGSILCVGGSDAREHCRDVYRLRYVDSKLELDRIADLPVPLANACGAVVDGLLIISGGIKQPDAPECERRTWGLDLKTLDSNEPKTNWRELPPLPDKPRMLSTAASSANAFWVIGGVTLVAPADGKPVREYLHECWKLELDRERFTGRWIRQADMPFALAASPGPTIATNDRIWVLGGDDGSQVGVEHSKHRGFSKKIVAFDIPANRWHISSEELPVSRVTVPLVTWSNGWVIPSGEAKPGIRSSDVWWFSDLPR